MFQVNDDKSIYMTRGDAAVLEVSANVDESTAYMFKSGDIVRFKVFERKQPDMVVIEKDILVEDETTIVTIVLERADTKIGDLISKPKDYWYEVELNPETVPQTIICYDADGPKIFRLFPEGED